MPPKYDNRSKAANKEQPDAAAERRAAYLVSLKNRLRGYERQGYAPTHRLCSVVGYLVGVKEENFYAEEHSFLERKIFDRMERDRAFQAVRLLCTLRVEVLQNCTRIFDAFKDNLTPVDGFLTENLLQRLYSRHGYDMTPRRKNGRRDVNDYLLQINEALTQALNRAWNPLVKLLREEFPDGVKYEYLRKMIPFPGGTNFGNMKQLTLLYNYNQLKYPYRCYMNLAQSPEDLPEFNLFFGDDDLIEWAYRMNNETPDILWKFRVPYGVRESTETLHNFLTSIGNYNYHFMIDGCSMQADQVLALMRELREEELERVQTIHLFCCSDVYQNWRFYLGDYADKIHGVEVSSTAGAADRRADIATNISLNQFGVPSNTAVVLVTKDETVFSEVYEEVVVAQRRSLCLVTERNAPDFLMNTVSRHSLAYCFVDDLDIARLTGREEHLSRVLRQKFPLRIANNLKALLEECAQEIPAAYSAQELESIYRQAVEGLRLVVEEDGGLRIELQ